MIKGPFGIWGFPLLNNILGLVKKPTPPVLLEEIGEVFLEKIPEIPMTLRDHTVFGSVFFVDDNTAGVEPGFPGEGISGKATSGVKHGVLRTTRISSITPTVFTRVGGSVQDRGTTILTPTGTDIHFTKKWNILANGLLSHAELSITSAMPAGEQTWASVTIDRLSNGSYQTKMYLIGKGTQTFISRKDLFVAIRAPSVALGGTQSSASMCDGY